jgi:hypothetical protein
MKPIPSISFPVEPVNRSKRDRFQLPSVCLGCWLLGLSLMLTSQAGNFYLTANRAGDSLILQFAPPSNSVSQIMASSNLLAWDYVGGPIIGNGLQAATQLMKADQGFYRVSATPAAAVATYSAPGGVPASTSYSVSVSDAHTNRPVFVYQYEEGSYCYFSFGGGMLAVSITVPTNIIVSSVDIRPKSANLKPILAGQTIRFSLARPLNLSIEINGRSNPLFLFANPLEVNPPAPGTPGVVYFGPGITNLPGGQYIVPDGKTVYIAGGAIVKGKFRIGSSTPSGTGVANVSILGRGIVDSTGITNAAGDPDPGRPLRINNSTNITVEGPIFLGQSAWGLVANQSSGVAFRNTKVINWRFNGAGTPDGMDVVGSRNVTMDSVFVRSYDDGIAIKNNKFGYYGPVENVVISNAVIWSGDAGNGLEIGWETYNTDTNAQYVRNILVLNSDIIHKNSRTNSPNSRAAISIHNGDNATVSHVTYQDLRIEETEENIFNFRIFAGSTSECGPSSECRGKIQDITLTNVSVTGGSLWPSVFQGYDARHLIDRVTFQNVTYLGRLIENPTQGQFDTNAFVRGLQFR